MLNVEVKLLTVDWKVVLEALLPTVMKRTKAMENPPFAIRLLNKLDEVSEPAFQAGWKSCPARPETG